MQGSQSLLQGCALLLSQKKLPGNTRAGSGARSRDQPTPLGKTVTVGFKLFGASVLLCRKWTRST